MQAPQGASGPTAFGLAPGVYGKTIRILWGGPPCRRERECSQRISRNRLVHTLPDFLVPRRKQDKMEASFGKGCKHERRHAMRQAGVIVRDGNLVRTKKKYLEPERVLLLPLAGTKPIDGPGKDHGEIRDGTEPTFRIQSLFP